MKNILFISLWKELTIRYMPRRPTHLLHVFAVSAVMADDVTVQAEDGLGGLTVKREAALGNADHVLPIHSAQIKYNFPTEREPEQSRLHRSARGSSFPHNAKRSLQTQDVSEKKTLQ